MIKIFKIIAMIGIKKRRYPSPNNRNNPKNPNNPIKGFTISEMLIVTTIIAFLTAAGIKTYFSERDRYEFNNALVKTIGIFKTARNLAITSSPVYISQSIGNVIPADGYGVHINLDPNPASEDDLPVMTLFANLGSGAEKADYQNDDDPNTFNVGTNTSDRIIETYEIPRQVIFQFFQFDVTESAGQPDTGLVDKWSSIPATPLISEPDKTEAVVIFKPPLADTLIRGPAGVNHADKTFSDDNDFDNLETLGMKFRNPYVPETSPKRCQGIYLNRIKTFPEITHSDCT